MTTTADESLTVAKASFCPYATTDPLQPRHHRRAPHPMHASKQRKVDGMG
ncbi:MAG TPA: hypothetical protein IAA99_00080 [Candidatus Avibacteroides faecavium]|nr:hypothetical protein [Candidatus Avibacteroides faecavium]